MSVKVSFITINYNSSKYTIELIKSIDRYTSLDYEIIVVDNCSMESDLENLENFTVFNDKVTLVKNSKNEGFSSGNMLGVTYAQGEYFFFINNDTELLNDSSLFLSHYLDNNERVALVTAKVKDEFGNFSSSYKLFPSLIKELLGNSLARKISKQKFPSNKVELKTATLVEVVSGSCMLFRANDFLAVKGFDKSFFLYCEEEDLSKRVWNSGKEVAFVPQAEILHHSGGSTTKSFEIEREYYISYHILIQKHFNIFVYNLLRALLLLKLFRRSFKRKNGWKLFLCGLRGCPKTLSLRPK